MSKTYKEHEAEFNSLPTDEQPEYQHSSIDVVGNYLDNNTPESATLSHKAYNVGSSDYSAHSIQPWDIWREYNLNPWDADIIKRTLRTKEGNPRVLDYEKIIHICTERIAQLNGDYTKGDHNGK